MMNVNCFDLAFGSTSWADDVADLLPTAPARASQPVDPSESRSQTGRRPTLPIPTEPPFNAFIGNLSFDVTDRDIENLFGDLSLKSIRLIQDPQTHQPKGFGYVEFEDAQSLEQAIKMDGESVLNRRIRINVAEGSNEI